MINWHLSLNDFDCKVHSVMDFCSGRVMINWVPFSAWL
jgi:hypothetical protein